MKSPLRIGIMGAPGVGKSELATAIDLAWTKAEELGVKRPIISSATWNQDEMAEGGFPSIDGFFLGPMGSWRTALALYVRTMASRHQMKEDLSVHPTIEVGTGLDRFAHCGVELTDLSDNLLDLDEMGARRMVEIQQALPALGIVLIESWNYDCVFYLPVDDEADEFSKKVDKAINELMVSYIEAGTPFNIMRLEGGGSSDKAGKVVDVLRKLVVEQDAPQAETEEENGTDGTDTEATEGPE